MTMNKVTTIISIGIVVLVGIAVVNYNSIDVEKINDDISSIPPSAGGLKPKDSDTSSTSGSNGLGSSSTSSSSGLKTTKIYKVTTADGVTSFSDVPRGVAKKRATTTSTASSATETTSSTSTDSTSTGSTSTGSTSTGSTSTGSTSTGSTSTTETVEAPVVEEVVEAEVIDVVTTAPPESTSSSSTTSSSSSGVMHSKWEAQFAMLPQDQNGWSIVTPASDSRFIYVSSSSGNDSTAKAYTSTDITNPHNPPAGVTAFKTIYAASKLQRAGYSDWILLKKGDEWTNGTLYLKSGRSSAQPFVLTSYGASSERPLVKTGTSPALVAKSGVSFLFISGIEFYAHKRDPDSMDFAGWDNVGSASGFMSTTPVDKVAESITLEDNVFRFYGGNVVFTGFSKQKNMVVRRNHILNAYTPLSHSQGLFASKISLLVEENLIDHNGWYQQNYEVTNSRAKGQATWFNHNVYLSSPYDTVVTGNLITRSSSIGVKVAASADGDTEQNFIAAQNLSILDNFFTEGELGISAGGNKDFNNGYRFKNILVKNNVFMHIGDSQPLRRRFAMGVDAVDWDGGMISGNHLLYTDNQELNNIHGIDISGLTRNVTVTNNTIKGLRSKNPVIAYKDEPIDNLDMSNNTVIETVSSSRRDLTTYLSLGNSTNGVSTLVQKAKAQSKFQWSESLTAVKLNDYLMN